MIVSILGITVGYTALNTELNISGDAYVRGDKDIRVTNLKMIKATNKAYETYNSKFYKGTPTTLITLPKFNSTITYEVAITNQSDVDYLLTKIIEESYSNNLVKYEIDIQVDDIISSHTTKVFKIKLTNSTSDSQNNFLVLKYQFEEQTRYVLGDFGYTGNDQTFTAPYDGIHNFKKESYFKQPIPNSNSIQDGHAKITLIKK